MKIETRAFKTRGGATAVTAVLEKPLQMKPPLDREGRCKACGASGPCLGALDAHWSDCRWANTADKRDEVLARAHYLEQKKSLERMAA